MGPHVTPARTVFTVGLAFSITACVDDVPQAEGEESAVAVDGPVWRRGPPLPAPVANNAVAAVETREGIAVLSFLGVDSTKAWNGVTNASYRWDFGSSDGWREIAPVPGPGRLASTVQVVGRRAYVFGGYTVAEDGSEKSLPDVNVYDPASDAWSRVADMPVPVDDAVSGIWRDSLIYLVSGWHDTGNVPDVQIYDPARDAWSVATPIPGEPVFGHSGSITGDDIIYVGGTKIVDQRPRFVVDTAAWRGRIDDGDPARITWERLPHPPGLPLYRAAGGTVGDLVVLLGGSDNPYNYDGVGYNGTRSSPLRQFLTYEPSGGWLNLPDPPVATMDHRTLGVAAGHVFLVGGMLEDQVVSDRVWFAEVDGLLGGLAPAP